MEWLNLHKLFLFASARSVCMLPVVLVLVDVSDKKTRDQLDPHLAYTLNQHSNIPAVLLLNKVRRHAFCSSPVSYQSLVYPGGFSQT